MEAKIQAMKMDVQQTLLLIWLVIVRCSYREIVDARYSKKGCIFFLKQDPMEDEENHVQLTLL